MSLCVLTLSGMTAVGGVTEDDPRKLYVPEDTQASRDEQKILANFGLTDTVSVSHNALQRALSCIIFHTILAECLVYPPQL